MNNDTTHLLAECNAGIKMGVSSIEDVLDDVKSEDLLEILSRSKQEHQFLGSKTHELLNSVDLPTKEPHAIAKSMSHMKTGVMMAIEKSDATIADLITDGCNMGVKSLHKYLNKYKTADEKSKEIANKLIEIETTLANNVSAYL